MQQHEMGELLREGGWRVTEALAATEVMPQAGDLVLLSSIQRCHDWGRLPERSVAVGASLVVVPLYHPLGLYHRRGRYGLDALLARVLPGADRFAALRWGKLNLRSRAAQVLALADRVLLVHEDEELWLSQDFDFRGGEQTTRVVPVAVHAHLPAGPVPARPFGERDFVFCAGRIEPLKNSLAVLRASSSLGLPVAFAGALPGIRHALYEARMRSELRGHGEQRARWLGELPYEQLRGLMAEARVHVLASWTEVVGRVSLEAALAGAAVVASDTGHAARYLGRDSEGVFLFDPERVGDLERALDEAWQRGSSPSGDLVLRVRDHFTWEVVAPRFLEALPS
jgi:glycosyltransferase involved in cell wall biosynthesis